MKRLKSQLVIVAGIFMPDHADQRVGTGQNAERADDHQGGGLVGQREIGFHAFPGGDRSSVHRVLLENVAYSAGETCGSGWAKAGICDSG